MATYNPRQLFFLLIADIVSVIAALTLSSFLRIHISLGTEGPVRAFISPLWLFPVAIAIWITALSQAGVYKPNTSVQLEFRAILAGHLVATLIFFGTLYLIYRDYSRLQSAYLVIVTFMFLVMHRLVLRAVKQKMGARGVEEHRVIIVGAEAYAHHVADTITKNEWKGLKVIGHVHAADDSEAGEAGQVGCLGTIHDLPQLVETHAIDEVLITMHWFNDSTKQKITTILKSLEGLTVNIRLAPDYADLAYFRVSVQDFGGVPLLSLREPVLTPFQSVLKRLFDVIFSVAVLVLAAPLFAIIGLAIRHESRGDIILKQTRIGYHSKPFTMYKFRSMYAHDVPLSAETAFMKAPDDPRVTRVGRFLRRTSLDELPQFYNVLIGNMSVVGPRPEVPWNVDHYEAWQRKRFEVPQGITGWWQIKRRSEQPMYLHTTEDLFYIQHYSLLLDIKIIMSTVFAIFTGRGAF
jgi:exopolysaccharide biosynthesis polyprenyl glycosylphosphotransferase